MPDQIIQTELFENAFHHAPIGMALVSTDGAFLKVNDAFCRLTGYSQDEMLACDFQKITYPEDLARDLHSLAQLLQGDIPGYQMDKRYVRKDGSIVWVHLSVSLVRDASGAPKHFISQVQDLTQRRDAEGRYRLLAENVRDIVSLYDLSGTCLFVSPSIERVLGFTSQERIGTNIFDTLPADEHEPLRQAIALLQQTPRTTEAPHRMRVRRKDGHCIWMEATGHLAHDDAGRSVIVSVSRDVTAKVEQELALAEAKARAEEASEAKSAFVAEISHEIRTPLTAVLGFAGQLAARVEADGEAKRQAEGIVSASQHLLRIVNDVLDLSRIEAKGVDLNPVATDWLDCVRGAIAMFEPIAAAKGIALKSDLPASAKPVLLDEVRLRQVLVNLIGNAVKFTDIGRVEVKARYSDACLQITIADTGPGIPREMHERLFKAYSRGAPATREGSGLGLAIVRRLVEAMEGDIEFSSEDGAGTRFELAIPAPKLEMIKTSSASDAVSLSDVRVLIVDDNATNRQLARTILESAGARVREADGGRAGLEAAQGEAFDVLLIDLRMPDMAGNAVLDELHALPGPNQQTPALAFSADLLRSRASERFAGYVLKPFTVQSLVDQIASAAGKLRSAA